MSTLKAPNRCRIVIVAPQTADSAGCAALLKSALAGGDVASVILPQYELDDDGFERYAAPLVPLVQARGAAVMIAGASSVAFRTGADGLHVEGREALADAMSRHAPKLMVGAGGPRDRDEALVLGELQPDYVFFGRFGYDTRPEPHRRNLALGRWWAEMTRLPCIVAGGSDIASVGDVARTGVEFVALSSAVFGQPEDPATRVAAANAILDDPAFDFGD